MTRSLYFAAIAGLLAACAPRVPVADIAALHDCADLFLEAGAIQPGECRMDAAGQTLRVTFAAVADGSLGRVSIDVFDGDGVVVQTLSEDNVSQYLAPTVQDVDGDGRADILIARETGNVNTVYAIWIFGGDRNLYRRVGEVSGFDISRTQEGLIAVQARSAAAVRSVGFYRLDEAGLVHVASVELEAREGAQGAVNWRCRLTDAPGASGLNLSPEAAEAKFCAEQAVVGGGE